MSNVKGKTSEELSSESVKARAASGVIGGFGAVGFSKPKVIKLGGVSRIAKIPTKTGFILGGASLVAGFVGLGKSIEGARKAKKGQRLKTFVKTEFKGFGAHFLGRVGGIGASKGSLLALRKSRGFTKSFAARRAAKGGGFKTAKEVGGRVVKSSRSKGFKGPFPKDKIRFVRIRGRIIPIRVKRKPTKLLGS